MSLYFIADLHFGGQYANRYYVRPFKSYKHYEDTVISNLNDTLTSNDDIYFIGDFIDFSFAPERCNTWESSMSLAENIPGRKHLILGNNEERLIATHFKDFEKFRKYTLSCGFVDCSKSSLVNVKGNIFYLNHYPENVREDYLNLYGHIHRTYSVSIHGFNVSCELTGYHPLSDMQLIALFDREFTYSLLRGHIPHGNNINRNLWKSYRDNWIKYINQL